MLGLEKQKSMNPSPVESTIQSQMEIPQEDQTETSYYSPSESPSPAKRHSSVTEELRNILQKSHDKQTSESS